MSILDDDLLEKCDYQVIKHILTNIEEKDIPALQQAWYDTFAWCGLSQQNSHLMIKLLELYRDDLGINYKSKRFPNGTIFVINHIIDKNIINSWLYDFKNKMFFKNIEELNTFAVGCLNISWVIISQFELGIYKNQYQMDIYSNPNQLYDLQNVESKYDYYRQQICLLTDMIKKGIL